MVRIEERDGGREYGFRGFRVGLEELDGQVEVGIEVVDVDEGIMSGEAQ